MTIVKNLEYSKLTIATHYQSVFRMIYQTLHTWLSKQVAYLTTSHGALIFKNKRTTHGRKKPHDTQYDH
jgi:hypothetical protein